MSFFSNIVDDMGKLEKEYLGPDYPYYKKIRNPKEMGMSSSGSVSALASDIDGIIRYVEVLVSGTGKGSTTGKPLGDKFFLKTGGQCKDYLTNKLVTRSMYINNVPTKKLPIISDVTGMNFSDIRGLVPGVVEDLYSINPVKMFRAFMEGNEPLCAEVNLDVVNVNDVESKQSGYIPIVELQDLQNDGKIPSGILTPNMVKKLQNNTPQNNDTTSDKETFLNICDIMNGKKLPAKQETTERKKMIKELDPLSNIYLLTLAVGMLYILYRFMKK